MSNTSATGGYLTSTPILEDQALFDFMHDLITGITGMDPTLVRPRWQPEPPDLPDFNVNWCAFGITEGETEPGTAYVVHQDSPQILDQLQRHETLDVFASFYGPNASSLAKTLRDGLQVAQNREILQLASMGLVSTGDVVTAPELIKERWLYRVDLSVKIRRQIVRTFTVLDLASASGTLNNEIFVEPIVN